VYELTKKINPQTKTQTVHFTNLHEEQGSRVHR